MKFIFNWVILYGLFHGKSLLWLPAWTGNLHMMIGDR